MSVSLSALRWVFLLRVPLSLLGVSFECFVGCFLEGFVLCFLKGFVEGFVAGFPWGFLFVLR